MNFSDELCRLCLKKFQALGLHIHSHEGIVKELQKKILECLSVDIPDTELSIYTKFVCNDCICKLDFFHEFRETSIKSQSYLNDMLQYYDQNVCASEIIVISDKKHILSEINFATNEFILDENEKSQFNKDYDEIIQSLEKEELNFSKIDADLVMKNELEMPATNLAVKQTVFEDCFDDFVENIPEEHPISSSEENLEYGDDFSGIEDQHMNKDDLISEIAIEQLEQLKPDVETVDSSTSKSCDICSKNFVSNYKLKTHKRTHTKEAPFKCKIDNCGKSFKSKIGLAEHIAKHTGQYEYACEICGKGFQNRSYLLGHQRIHSDLKPFKCNTCGQSFKGKQSLIDHKNRHLGVKPFPCNNCEKKFITKALLMQHEKTHVDANEKYSCSECLKTFVSKSYLKVHSKIHKDERPFVCEVCQKAFLTRYDLKIHMTLHTGEKSYVCEVCGKNFARRDAFNCHRRSHTGEKPYKCSVCGQGFTQFTPMMIHKRLHSNESDRLFKCKRCSKTFVSKATLKTHMKKHVDVDRDDDGTLNERLLVEHK